MKFFISGLTISIIISCVYATPIRAQAISYEYAYELSNMGYGEFNCEVTDTDADGNLFVAGSMNRTIDFGLQSGFSLVTNENINKKYDGIIATYDSTGILQDVRIIGGNSGGCFIDAMSINANNDIIIAGHFRDSAFFDLQNPLEPTYAYDLNQTIMSNSFIARYDSDFNLIWVKLFDLCLVHNIETDAQNNIFLSGEYQGLTDIDPSGSQFNIEPIGTIITTDLFVAKYNSNGNLMWGNTIASDNTDYIGDMTIDSDGNVLLGGSFSALVWANGTSTISGTNNIDFGVVVTKFSTDGGIIWHKVVPSNGTSGYIAINSIVTDTQNNIYFTGISTGNHSIDSNPISDNGVYIIKLNPNGQTLWAKSSQTTCCSRGYSIALDQEANIYICGIYENTLDGDFNEGVSNIIQPIANQPDIPYYFVASYNSSGEFRWIHRIPDSVDDVKLEFVGHTNVWVFGNINSPVDFDPTPATDIISPFNSPYFATLYSSEGVYQMADIFAIGTNNDEFIQCVTSNANGDLVVAGKITGFVDFDKGPETMVLNATATNHQDSLYYVASYASNGGLNWVIPIKGPLVINGIDCDSQGNIYITGGVQGSVDFDPSENQYLIFGNNGDLFLAKYDSEGSLQWAYKAGNNLNEFGTDVKVDHSDNVIITGKLTSLNNTDFDFGASVFNLNGSNGPSFFIAKYNGEGELIFATKGRATSTTDLAVDSHNNIYITGYFQSIFNGGTGLPTVYATGVNNGNPSDMDYFIAKYDSLGLYDWMLPIGSLSANNSAADVTVDHNDHIVWCGHFDLTGETIDIDPNDNEPLLNANSEILAKFSDDGSLIWGIECGAIRQGRIDVDANGNITMASYFENSVDIDPTENQQLVFSNNAQALLHTRYSPFGTLLGSQVYNVTGAVTPLELDIDQFNKINTVGRFIGPVNLNPEQAANDHFHSYSFYNLNGIPTPIEDKKGFLLKSYQEEHLAMLPKPNAIFMTDNNSICENICINFYDNSAYSPSSWSWSFPGASPSSSIDQNPQNICYSNSGQYDVELIATNEAGSDTIFMPNYITVNSINITSINDDMVICNGESLQLSASGGSNYNWSPNTNLSNASIANPIANPTVTTTYTVIGTAGFGCSDTNHVTIEVLDLPVVTLDLADDTLCINQFPYSLNGGWPDSGVYSGTGVVGDILDVDIPGNYTITYAYTDLNGCTGVLNDNIVVEACISIEEELNINPFLIYPNPANNYIILNCNAEMINATAEIYSSDMRLIKKHLIKSQMSQMEITDLSNGIYFLKVGTNIKKFEVID